MTVLGTRPEIIRLSLVIKLLDDNCDHLLVHTGQNYDDRLNGLFFRELDVRLPDERLEVRGATFGEQIGPIVAGCEALMQRHRPDRVLVLGDTNSGLSAIAACRMGIPVYHMEAGNRCRDFRVPEEVNRRIIDHVSSVLMPYTNRSRDNLLHEGFAPEKIYVTGNPIKQVLDHYGDRIASSRALVDYSLCAGKFFLVTMHRAENVDIEQRLRSLVTALCRLPEKHGYPVICSLHPRTRGKVAQFGIDLNRAGLHFLEPLGFFDFVRLEQTAFCILSDSGTVQEEACIFGVPVVTLRDVTERPETIECGSNVLSGCDPERIARLVGLVVNSRAAWQPPPEYLVSNVASTVGKIVLSR